MSVASASAGAGVVRGYRYRAYPTVWQQRILETWQHACADAWNAALEQRQTAHRMRGVTLWRRDQQPELQDCRAEVEQIGAAPAQLVNTMLVLLDRAYEAAFRRLRHGETPGFPRYMAWRDAPLVFPSYAQSHEIVSVRDGTLYVRLTSARDGERFGALRLRAHRPLPDGARLGQMALRCKAGRWHAAITVETTADAPSAGGGEIGINRGVAVWVALSDRTLIHPDPIYPLYADEIADLQRRVSAAKRGSRRRRELVRRLNRQSEKVAARRRQRACELANMLLDRYELIAIEDYDTRRMLTDRPDDSPAAQARHLHRKIADAAWADLAHVLTYKAAERGARVVRVPTPGISTTCCDCGADIADEAASAVRGYRDVLCDCGARHHVDVLAARNVLDRAKEIA